MAIKFDLAFGRRIAVFAVFLHLVLGLDCPSGWDGYGNSCYKFVIQSPSMRGINWENARRACLGYGGDLVSIANQSEMSFVYDKSSKVWNQHYWIGLNDRHNERQFAWSDGTPYNASVYSNWYPGEPNDQAGEDCVELYRTSWNDNGCKQEYGYICEKSKDYPPLYEKIGCFQDQESRAIPSLEGQDTILDGRYEARLDSIEKCYRAAKKRGFHIFAVQNGGWCASSATAAKTFNKYGNSSACKLDGKGGPWANQVYYITGYDAVGCYKDNESRAIPTLEGKDSILDGSYSSRTNPIAKCAVAAMRAGYSMFAVQNGGWCAASASAPQMYDKYGKSTACKDDGEGGPWANQVYGLKVPSQAPIVFTVIATNSTTIKASWQLSPADSERGIIKGFKLIYKKKDVAVLPTTLTINGSEIRAYYATGLDENTEYEFQVLAFSVFGDGPKSAVKNMRTMDNVPPRIMKDVCPTSVTCERFTVCSLCCYATSDSPVKYSWKKNGQKPVNGELKVINGNIVITPRSAKDYGVYVCNVENSFGSTSYEVSLIEDETSEEGDSLSNIYRIIVIALSCIVCVLLIAVGLLTWRLCRALWNKKEKTPERNTSYSDEQPEIPRGQHVPQGDGYCEPLKVMPPAPSHYQSLHSNVTSAKYGNVVSNIGTDNGQEDELYLTIIP